jgi:hypothetical protein
MTPALTIAVGDEGGTGCDFKHFQCEHEFAVISPRVGAEMRWWSLLAALEVS